MSDLREVTFSSYDLAMGPEGLWTLYGSGTAIFRSNFSEVVRFMVSKLDFDLAEIELAAEEMDKLNHNRAHFGTYKSFIFTEDQFKKRGLA